MRPPLLRVPRAISIEAVVMLGFARLALRTLPIRWIAGRVEGHVASAPASAEARHAGEIARDVGAAVRAASRRTPWTSTCLVQALAGKWMLRRRGMHGTIRLGVAKNGEGALQAHAWLCAGDAVLIGGPQIPRFTPVGDLE